MDKLPVLDKGYVRYVDHMGTDLSVVNAARVSYDRESTILEERDIKLLNFLGREYHPAPLRHGIITLECYAPLIVKNQWFKHLIGGVYKDDAEFMNLDPFFAWNESSRRYITEEEEFYEPNSAQWRTKPANSKQGSGANMDRAHGKVWTSALHDHINAGHRLYRSAMDSGMAPEQARLFLPAYALYVRWRWTTSLQGITHFIGLRDKPDAQHEIREYAVAVRKIASEHFPHSIAAFCPDGHGTAKEN